MQLLTEFKEYSKKLVSSNDRLLLAVSGGVDSVVLCELCSLAGYSFEIAHVNFQLRKEESDDDEKLVRALAAKYRVPIHVKRFDTSVYANEHKFSIQVAARELRYNWFDELLGNDLKWILTAHHAGDNIETLLMNFFRGTGINGLRGILPKNGKIIRPLLFATKEEIIRFARDNNLAWREDSSNSSDKYSRNYFRQTIIPLAANIFPEAEKNLSGNIARFRDIELLYDQSIDRHKKNLLETRGREVYIPVLKIKRTEPLNTVLYEIIKSYHFTAGQLKDVLRLLDAEQGKFVQSHSHRIIRNRNWLIIAPIQDTDAGIFIIEDNQDHIDFPAGRLQLRVTSPDKITLSADTNTTYLDMREVKYPLLLRKWKQGDYFYPLGMKKKKKISRFLIDQKISPTQKENTWVLESDKRICWVAGNRLDDRFRLKKNTKSVLKISLSAP